MHPPPTPAWVNFTLTMDCTPESRRCYTLCHKVRTYKEYHSVFPSSELGLSQPLSRQRVGGWGESQFRRGAHTVVLFICTYFVLCVLCATHLHVSTADTRANVDFIHTVHEIWYPFLLDSSCIQTCICHRSFDNF